VVAVARILLLLLVSEENADTVAGSMILVGDLVRLSAGRFNS
jgi:hypothetical protein